MPAEKRSPDDAAGASTGAFGGAALGALSGGGDALGGRRPAAHLPSTHAKQLRQRAPSRGPWATQMSAPMPTAGRSANRRAHYERIGRALRHMDAAVGLSAACAAHHRGEGEEKPRIDLPLKVVGPTRTGLKATLQRRLHSFSSAVLITRCLCRPVSRRSLAMSSDLDLSCTGRSVRRRRAKFYSTTCTFVKQIRST
jgi:hypothetical protein